MPLQIIRNDITKMRCDAIVNSTNVMLAGGGGVDGAIRKAAGKGLFLECLKLRGCRTGKAKITRGHRLPCRYIIHTVGPRWKGGDSGEEELLRSCYRECLRLAKMYRCETLAFPLISSGVYGYPKDAALRVALDEIERFLADSEMLIFIVVYDKASYQISTQLYSDIGTYVDDQYVDVHKDPLYDWMVEQGETQLLMPADIQDVWERMPDGDRQPLFPIPPGTERPDIFPIMPGAVGPDTEKDNAAEPRIAPDDICCLGVSPFPPDMPDDEIMRPHPGHTPFRTAGSLEEALNQIDESFTQMLFRKIEEKGLTDVQCYKKANVDRKLFSKIRSDIHYHPKKKTVLAFAVALELSLEETEEFLMKAGYAFSRSSKFDIIVQYFIMKRNYNIFEINEALFAFDQSLLGS